MSRAVRACMMPRFSALAALAVGFAPAPAHAEDEEGHVAPPAEEPAPQAHVTGALGAAAASTGGGVVVMDVTGLWRHGALALGGALQYGESLFGASYVSTAPAVGAFAATPRWLDLGVLGLVGIRAYSHVGKGWGSDDPGMSATLPYAGARAVAALAVGGRTRFTFGVHAFADADLGRKTKSYSYVQDERDGFLGGNRTGRTTTETATHTAGFLFFGAMVALGATF